MLADRYVNLKTENIEQIIIRLKVLESSAAKAWIEDLDMLHYYNLSCCIARTLQNATDQLNVSG